MNQYLKVYVNKAGGKYFVCLLFAGATSRVLETFRSKKLADESAKYWAQVYNCEVF